MSAVTVDSLLEKARAGIVRVSIEFGTLTDSPWHDVYSVRTLKSGEIWLQHKATETEEMLTKEQFNAHPLGQMIKKGWATYDL